MKEQLDLFAWADARPSNVVDAVPSLIRKAAMETVYRIPRPKDVGVLLEMRRTA